MLVRVDLGQLRDETGTASTGTGDTLPVPELLELASQAEIIPAVLNHAGGILCYGRTRRLATAAQRRALALRDGGCSFPGCTRPAAWTEAHHVQAWYRGGATDLDNLCLLCSYHHRNFERLCWLLAMTYGVPMWIPPPWVDPERRPRRNTAHHLADFPA